jgi:hypothetical protein
VEVVAGELPLERLGDLLVVTAEAEQPLLEGGEFLEVVGLEDLALHDREVDLGLVEPGGVDRGVDHDEVGPGALEAVDRAPAAVGGAVVDDQEDALGLGVGFDRPELLDERVERLDAVLGRAAVEDAGAARVPGGQVAERSPALVLVLDPLAAAGRGRPGAVLARSRLDRGFLDCSNAVENPAGARR